MGNKRKRTRNRRGMQVVTLCISTTMVLILLGMVVFSVLMARNLSNHMKENLTVTVMLKDYVTVNQAHRTSVRNRHRKTKSRNWAVTRPSSWGSILSRRLWKSS